MDHNDHMMPAGGMATDHNMSMAPDHNMTHSMMHMTFFWGHNSEILFSGWPGTRSGMYALALVFVFFLSLIAEFLSHCRFIKNNSHNNNNNIVAGLIQTAMYAIRTGLLYLVMLAVMSFNVGVLIVAIAGHSLGFFLFGSRVFNKNTSEKVTSSDLPPASC